ncbi:uncharacterized protein [Miscanthus floridulus]|uniref:uncharacterized protein n=1 Tax=Miscanthus floridulus TaxID=154761 RepID=UPI003458014E
MTKLATPTFLWWLESTLTFDQTDHPESVPQPGRYLLVVDPIVSTKWLTKVLMDGGSGLNIMYVETLDAMGVDRALIRPTRAPFHGIVPRKQAMPLGQIDLSVTFGGVITFSTSFQHAYECEVECCDHAVAIVAFEELVAIEKEITKEAPDLKKLTASFKPVEGSKEVLIDLGSPKGKVVHIGTTLFCK